MDLFDEFGNYIGSDQEESPVEQKFDENGNEDNVNFPSEGQPFEDSSMEHSLENEATSASINEMVLHANKLYYPTSQEVYGKDVRIIVHEEDTQPLDQPIVEPVKIKTFQIKERKGIPETTYSVDYLQDLLQDPERIYNVAVLGSLHSGKTSLLDLAVGESHLFSSSDSKTFSANSFTQRYSDCLYLERERGITLKCKGMTFALSSSKGKSHVITFLDTPGHSSFTDEVSAALRLADSVIFVVDPVEGFTSHAERLLKAALQEGLELILFINKLDRLFLELKLPPNDAYLLLKATIDQINTFLHNAHYEKKFIPQNGNVVFGCLSDGWAFTLNSFASLYMEKNFANRRAKFQASDLSKMLWGERYFENGTFKGNGKKNAFVSFVLEPIYKLYISVLQHDGATLKQILEQEKVHLTKKQFSLDIKQLIKVACKNFFGSMSIECVVDGMIDQLANSSVGNNRKLCKHLNSSQISSSYIPENDLFVHVGKIYGKESEIATQKDSINSFIAYGRVFSGILRKGQHVRLLGETFIEGIEEENSAFGQVEEIFIYQSRYQIPIEQATPGSIVAILLSNSLQPRLNKTICLLSTHAKSFPVFPPLSFFTIPTIKLAIEPQIPAELPKMIEGLRKVSKLYPMLEVKVEQSGEYVIVGPGELYLDCVMHDLRIVFGEIEVRVSEPFVRFCETVIETSSQKCLVNTPNHRNTFVMICGSLGESLETSLENGRVFNAAQKQLTSSPGLNDVSKDISSNAQWDPFNNRQLASFLQTVHNWDILEARNIWAFGSDPKYGTNVLIDDSIPGDTDKKALQLIKQNTILGFQSACREGPLCEETVRGVKFRLIDATISSDPLHRTDGQIISACRKVCYASMLTASPRLMEPIAFVEIQTISECISSIYSLLAKRRGHVIKEIARGGTPFFFLHALLPIIDSFGFECDLRIISQGQAFCHQFFSHWEIVPGDPLDSSLAIRPLEASDPIHMARDFALKTRKRRGLPLDISVEKYLE